MKYPLYLERHGVVYILNFDTEFLNYIKDFSYQIEKHLINLADELNQLIEPKYIKPFLNLCESMKEFCSNNSILWKIHAGDFNLESSIASSYDTAIKREKKLIDSIFKQEIQFKKDIKNDFENLFNEAEEKIQDLILKNEKDKNLNKLKQKLSENKKKLNNVKNIDNKINTLKNQLIEYINYYSENQKTLTQEILNDITEKVKHFIALSKQTDIKDKKKIDWPDCLIKLPNINEASNTSKLDILIWYSKIVKELKDIDKDIKNNLLKCIMNLNENQENLPIINLLMNINIDKISNIDRKNKQIIYGSLNAYFIYKLYRQESTSFLWNIEEYIKTFKNREEINDPYFISKVDDYIKSLADEFFLYIPKFKKSDFLFLFINVVKNDYKGNRDYKLGPLLSEFNCLHINRPVIDYR